ncbi:MAG TPA: hypothetical protein VFS21_25260 [Roseiflexaceae bacterium]|nr:hypothetical protein [Roseiflexaceae bacterium]
MTNLHESLAIIERLAIDTSERQPVYLLVTRSGRYLRVTSGVYHVLHALADGLTFEGVAARLSHPAHPVTGADVERAYRQIADRLALIEQGPQAGSVSFWLRVPLIPQTAVLWLARGAARLFVWWLALAVLLAGSVCTVLVADSIATLSVDGGSFLFGYSLFFLSLVAHELGHSGACARYGARPGPIGFTFYLIYPALYSNVSDAWRLKRWQRVVVDLGGIFLQLMLGLIYIGLYWLTGWQPLLVAYALILGSVVFSLNPILKFDGYWVLADLLGVTNLNGQLRRVFSYVVRRARGLPASPLPWGRRISLLVIGYSLVSVVFWVYVLVTLVPFVFAALVPLPALLGRLAEVLVVQQALPPSELLVQLLMIGAIVCIPFTLLMRLLIELYRVGAARVATMRGGAAAHTESG